MLVSSLSSKGTYFKSDRFEVTSSLEKKDMNSSLNEVDKFVKKFDNLKSL